MVEVNMSGPLFDGRAPSVFAAMAADCRDEVAAQASSIVHTILDRSIRNPTPYYETQITVERRLGSSVVHDRGVVYGPWLEGVSERNRTTSFDGYHAFRIARQEVEADIPRLTAAVVARHLEGLR